MKRATYSYKQQGSNNGDMVKVLATVVQIIRDFAIQFPDIKLIFFGSSQERTNLYGRIPYNILFRLFQGVYCHCINQNRTNLSGNHFYSTFSPYLLCLFCKKNFLNLSYVGNQEKEYSDKEEEAIIGRLQCDHSHPH